VFGPDLGFLHTKYDFCHTEPRFLTKVMVAQTKIRVPSPPNTVSLAQHQKYHEEAVKSGTRGIAAKSFRNQQITNLSTLNRITIGTEQYG
jgi:hypothetical protein